MVKILNHRHRAACCYLSGIRYIESVNRNINEDAGYDPGQSLSSVIILEVISGSIKLDKEWANMVYFLYHSRVEKMAVKFPCWFYIAKLWKEEDHMEKEN